MYANALETELTIKTIIKQNKWWEFLLYYWERPCRFPLSCYDSANLLPTHQEQWREQLGTCQFAAVFTVWKNIFKAHLNNMLSDIRDVNLWICRDGINTMISSIPRTSLCRGCFCFYYNRKQFVLGINCLMGEFAHIEFVFILTPIGIYGTIILSTFQQAF